jgi:hypothetical protein
MNLPSGSVPEPSHRRWSRSFGPRPQRQRLAFPGNGSGLDDGHRALPELGNEVGKQGGELDRRVALDAVTGLLEMFDSSARATLEEFLFVRVVDD